MFFATALRAKGDTKAVFMCRQLASAIAIPVGCSLVFLWGIYGAVLGMVLTYSTLIVLYRRTFLAANQSNMQSSSLSTELPDKSFPKELSPILSQLSPTLLERELEIKRIGQGGQGEVFAVQSPDNKPIWNSHCGIVVKLFHTESEELDQAIQSEFVALSRLNAVVQGRQFAGWHIQSPVPILRTETPVAIVMTKVPGCNFHEYLQRAVKFNATELSSAAAAIAEAISAYWQDERNCYGDFHLANILCDPTSKTISFIDPGMPRETWLCQDAPDYWQPASRDLAYLLFEVSTCSIKVSIFNRAASKRQRKIVDAILMESLRQLTSTKERESILEEIHLCTKHYLTLIPCNWSLQGVWQRFVRWKAARSIANTLNQLEY